MTDTTKSPEGVPAGFGFTINLPPETVTLIFHAVDAVEAVLIILSYPLVSTIFYVFHRSPLLHHNLKALILNLFVEYVVITLSRLFCLSGTLIFGRDDVDSSLSASKVYFTGPFVAAEMIRLVACTAFIFACPCFVIERAVASIWLKSYETLHHSRILGIVIAFQWIMGAISTYCFCNGALRAPVIIGILAVIMLLCVMLYSVLAWVNNRRYSLYLKNRRVLCLSERYQLAENLRTQKMLSHLLTTLCGANILCLGAFIFMSYGSGNFLQPCLKAVFDYSVVIYCFLFPLISITSVADLRLSYIMWFYRCRRRVLPYKVNEGIDDTRQQLSHLKNAKGKRMVFTVEQEKVVYFNTINEIWSAKDVKHRHRLRYTPNKYKY